MRQSLIDLLIAVVFVYCIEAGAQLMRGARFGEGEIPFVLRGQLNLDVLWFTVLPLLALTVRARDWCRRVEAGPCTGGGETRRRGLGRKGESRRSPGMNERTRSRRLRQVATKCEVLEGRWPYCTAWCLRPYLHPLRSPLASLDPDAMNAG